MAEERSPLEMKVLTNISQGIDSIYSDQLLCDLKVTVGHATFECHRLVLAAVSGYFQCLMTSSWRENSTGEVKIEHEDVTAESFQMLLDILYKRKEIISKETTKEILRMSIYLQVKFLEEHCLEFLYANMTPDVCVGTWMFAEKYQLHELARRASVMASDQIDKAVDSDEILHLPKAMLLIILGSQRKLSMDDLCRTILRWVEEDPDSRQAYFHELLPFVCFPQLSSAYIGELMNYYFDHPFREYMAKNISDAVCFNLTNQKPEVKRQIIAQQDRVATSPFIRKCAIVIGGCTHNDQVLDEVSAYRLDPDGYFSVYVMKPLPESLGTNFATCVWKNELYVSGGTQQATFFGKYKPANDEWEVLTALKHGLEKHAMTAVNGKIYVMGGLSLLRKKPSPAIRVYDVSKKNWGTLKKQLPLAVQDATVAVLGHRIYVFGGKDASKKPTDLVQCLDTTSGCLYEAGSLPFPAEEVVALSDGGTIYLLCDGSKVLKMKEHFVLADQKDKLAKNPEAEEQLALTSEVKTKHQDNQDVAAKGVTSSSVTFSDVGVFADVRVLSAFLDKGEVVACGSQTPDGAFQTNIRGMNLNTGSVAGKSQTLNKQQKSFGLQTLNIPQEFLK